jgi:hypothetical protein
MLGSRDSPRSALNSAHIISTLNPARINPADYLDLSHLRSLTIRFPESPSQKPGSINYQWQNPGTKSERIPFPSRSTGFMYYHQDRRAAPLEGSIRFRVVSDNAPSSFRDGRDLLLPSGSPWQISLVQIASLQAYSPICDQLLHENLATPAQLSQCRSLFGDRRIDPALTLFHLTQEFPFKFSMGGLCLMAVGEALHQVRFSNLFKANIGRKIHIPWTGMSPFVFPHNSARPICIPQALTSPASKVRPALAVAIGWSDSASPRSLLPFQVHATPKRRTTGTSCDPKKGSF